MPTIERMTGAADQTASNGSPDRPSGATGGPDAGVRQLGRLMAAAGIREPGDRGRLDEQQLARLLENKTPSQRIEIKTALMAARLYPRTLQAGTPVQLFGRR
jgi:hypothetical protein